MGPMEPVSVNMSPEAVCELLIAEEFRRMELEELRRECLHFMGESDLDLMWDDDGLR